MSSGLISFDINGVSHSLFFGMVATQIFAEKGVNEVGLLSERGEKKADDVKAFACIVYAGACNQADRQDRQRPSFSDCYDLTEQILMEGEDLQEQIFSCFRESRPTQNMYDRLGLSGNADGKGEKKKKSTGTK